MKSYIKKLIVNSRLLSGSLRYFFRGFPIVFLYHRFSEAGHFVPGAVSGDVFGQQLDMMMSHYNVLTLAECLEFYHNNKSWPQNTAVISVDDGHRDFYLYAFPELKKRDIKATFYVTGNFVNNNIWLWPDLVKYIITSSSKEIISFQEIENNRLFDLNTDLKKEYFFRVFCEYCKKIPNNQKDRKILELKDKLGVAVPDNPVRNYDAISWLELKEVADYGIEIGSHTMNHPILSRIDADCLASEITGSKVFLEEKLGRNVRTFCYPNSLPQDISPAVVSVTKESGYLGAVHNFGVFIDDPFLIPRTGADNDLFNFKCKVNRIEHLGYVLRDFRGKGSF